MFAMIQNFRQFLERT